MYYIWGAPETGKTQFVLITCIRACVDMRQRVAMFVLTNNSIKQVLKGIFSTLPEGNPLKESVVRLEVPTKSFFAEHPKMCENCHAQKRVAECLRSLDCMEEVMYERAYDCQ